MWKAFFHYPELKSMAITEKGKYFPSQVNMQMDQ